MTVTDRPATPQTRLSDPQDEVLGLFADQGPALFRFCRSLLRTQEEAEDVVQETFLKLLRHLQGAGERGNLKAWLFTVAANGCRDRLRTRWRWLPWSPDTDTRTAPDPDEPVDVASARRALQALAPRDGLLFSPAASSMPFPPAGACGCETPIGPRPGWC